MSPAGADDRPETAGEAGGAPAPEPTCRSCGRGGLEPILSLGRTPLANAFRTREELGRPEPAWPLDLAFCPSCSLAQITETVPPERLFEDYAYFSSYSDTMLAHARGLAERMIAERGLGPDHLVVEAASNDGYLLRVYRERGVPVLGIEPARNVARVAVERHGVRTICDYFNAGLARRLASDGFRADVFHAHNVLAHVADLNGFVEGIRRLLRDRPAEASGPTEAARASGIAVIEVPYIADMVDRCEFDTIYHEHLCYFSLTALQRLFRRHGLAIADAERLEIHGGSLRILAGRASAHEPGPAVKALLQAESARGVNALPFYRDFAGRVETLRRSLREMLSRLRSQGRRIAAYGAAAKGSTLLNTAGIGPDLVEFVVDRSEHKQGRFMPGAAIPIHAPAKLLETMPDYVLLLSWNLAAEILEQQEEYRRRGGRFIIPLPEPHVV